MSFYTETSNNEPVASLKKSLEKKRTRKKP